MPQNGRLMAVRAWLSVLLTEAGWGGGREDAGESEAGWNFPSQGQLLLSFIHLRVTVVARSSPFSRGSAVWIECNQLVTPFV